MAIDCLSTTYRQVSFDKSMTSIIKGVAIIFMIVLHVFGGSGWYESQYIIPLNDNASLLRFMGSLQICVGIYVFMIGFGYAHSKHKNLTYSVTHIKKLLGVYWPILFIFALPAGISSLYNNGQTLLYNMFGIDETLSWVSWFVYLYIYAMIVMPFFSRIMKKHTYGSAMIIIALTYIAMVGIKLIFPDFYTHPLLQTLFICLGWTPTIIVGYLFATKRLFDRIRITKPVLACTLSVVVIFMTLYVKSILKSVFIFNLDIFYAPVIICCVLILFTAIQTRPIHNIFQQLGDKSVYMWFVHGLFFTASTRGVYQKFVMVSDNLWIIAIWTIILSYFISIILKKIIDTN